VPISAARIEVIDAIFSYTVDGSEGSSQTIRLRMPSSATSRSSARPSRESRPAHALWCRRCLAADRGVRDKFIREYFGVDLALVWDVVECELPVFSVLRRW
jgi:hypothetical protein